MIRKNSFNCMTKQNLYAMSNDSDFTTKLPNGWNFQTSFGELKNGEFDDYAQYKMLTADIESFHLWILQFFKDFHALPVIGDKLDIKDSGFTVVERWIDFDKKMIILFLAEGYV